MPEKGHNFKITGNQAEIPSEDIWQWQKALEKGGFTQEERDKILGRLSPDYRWVKSGQKVRELILAFMAEVEKENGKRMTQEQRDKFISQATEYFNQEATNKSNE